MIIRTEEIADHGCWISDDRVYAFVAPSAGGIREIGYHGQQPVSKNSRIFAGDHNALQFFILGAQGKQDRFSFKECDWCPGMAKLHGASPFGPAEVRIAASGRTIIIDATLPEETRLQVVIDPSCKLTQVHGERTWETEKSSPGWISFRVHDRILLDTWIKNNGPYGGDFLIPERIRKKIFDPYRRSGLATVRDLRPEYRERPYPIYDAEVYIAIGSDDYAANISDGAITFQSPPAAPGGALAPMYLRFGDEPIIMEGAGDDGERANDIWNEYAHIDRVSPHLRIPGAPHVEEFFRTVPGLMESCIVRDVGVPRACPGAYYWLWAWDAMVATEASLCWTEPRLAAQTARFIQTHKGGEGVLPMQWTRALGPLDHQSHGALETLLAALVYGVFQRSGSREFGEEHYARMLSHLEHGRGAYDDRGLTKNIGFYPDLPLRFGRSENSAVAMEVGSMYTFCRIFENAARAGGNAEDAAQSAALADRIAGSFLKNFWHEEKQFLLDARDVNTGECNKSYPLFSLLFLISPLGLPLVRPRLDACATFITRHLLGDGGMRLLPAWDKNASTETVTTSWYPHWDRYALKLLRRAGKSDAIMLWLRNVERVLRHLGYAPEFLQLDGLSEHDPSAWLRHGSASNLNCVTGWYMALLEGLCGLESDPGGLTLLPLALPLPGMEAGPLRYFGGGWNIHITNGVAGASSFRVDGEDLQGVMKIPARFHDHHPHEIEINYGHAWPERCFLELNNAEVLETHVQEHSLEARVRPLGKIEVVCVLPREEKLYVNGKERERTAPDAGGRTVVELPFAPEYQLRISR